MVSPKRRTPSRPYGRMDDMEKENMRRWGLSNEPAMCDCGHTQTTTHLMQCKLCPKDLVNATPEELDVAKFWSKTS
ncbi:hypothetical protein JTB14_026732 [Gonioctena quinquepunctata]|nr:hypothetical protein JTB14_026732 [Gonioctena quinquepunctata]